MSNQLQPKQLLQLASEASKLAYAPYSNFYVGACLLFNDGSVVKGCNVENSSYGLSLCAERNALSTAVANGKKDGLIAVAIHSPNRKLCAPCGACRQWIVEFSRDTDVILEGTEGEPVIYKITDLLPLTFLL